MRSSNPALIFLTLLVLHALCDYPLQGDFLARAKNHRAPIPGVPWYQALLAHALIQAGAVALVLGPVYGTLEFIAHVIIDYLKSDGAIDYDVDQLLHVAAKAIWVLLFFMLAPLPIGR